MHDWTVVLGNVGGEPKLTYFPDGNCVVNFSVAANSRRRNRETQELIDNTTWYRCVAYGKSAETINQYVNKGDMIFVEGRVSAKAYVANNGQAAASLDLNVQRFKLIGARGGTQSQQSAQQQQYVGRPQQSAPPQQFVPNQSPASAQQYVGQNPSSGVAQQYVAQPQQSAPPQQFVPNQQPVQPQVQPQQVPQRNNFMEALQAQQQDQQQQAQPDPLVQQAQQLGGVMQPNGTQPQQDNPAQQSTPDYW